MLDDLFAKLLDMTITGSVVIAVVLLARLALKRMPKVFSYCLWSVVLLRLLCPVGIALPVSGVPQAPSVSEHYTLTDTDISFLNAGKAALEGIHHVTNYDPDTYVVQIPQKPQAPQVAAPSAVTCSPWETWVLFGRYLWLAGTVVMVGISLIKWGKLRRKLAEAVQLRENIYLVDGIATPFTMGLLRPRIYIPAGATEGGARTCPDPRAPSYQTAGSYLETAGLWRAVPALVQSPGVGGLLPGGAGYGNELR